MRRLRIQLIVILVATALLPAVPAALTARALVERSLRPWIQAGWESGSRAGLRSVQELLEREKEGFLHAIVSGDFPDTLSEEDWASFDPAERRRLEFTAPDSSRRGESIPVDPPDRRHLEAMGSMSLPQETRAGSDSVDRTRPDGGHRTRLRLLRGPERVRRGAGSWIVAQVAEEGRPPVWLARELDPDLVRRAGDITESLQRLELLRTQAGRLGHALLLAFLVVYVGVLLLVLLIGLFLASHLTRPLETLGSAMERVAAGSLETRLPTPAAGPLGRLWSQFNQMVSKLGRQQEELIRLERAAAWRDMARRLAHEIKNPLTPIQLAAQQLRDSYEGGNRRYSGVLTESTRIIEEEVEGLKQLVQEFSQFARLPEPRMRPTSISALLRDLEGLYGDRIRTSMTGEIEGRCDPDEVHRLLVNLINNALAAQEESGRTEPVDVQADASAAEIRLEVMDRGPGVPVGSRRRIFEPNVSTRGGMGLGLPIAEGIARAHGGSLEVDDRPGGGAIFRLRLPRLNGGDDPPSGGRS